MDSQRRWSGTPVDAIYAFRFAWHAMHPEDPVRRRLALLNVLSKITQCIE